MFFRFRNAKIKHFNVLGVFSLKKVVNIFNNKIKQKKENKYKYTAQNKIHYLFAIFAQGKKMLRFDETLFIF